MLMVKIRFENKLSEYFKYEGQNKTTRLSFSPTRYKLSEIESHPDLKNLEKILTTIALNAHINQGRVLKLVYPINL